VRGVKVLSIISGLREAQLVESEVREFWPVRVSIGETCGKRSTSRVFKFPAGGYRTH
jgi:hypothetical protein